MRRDTALTTPLTAYGFALIATACATAVSLPFLSFFAKNPFTPFYLAVAATAWYGGLGAGLVSVFGGAISAGFLLPQWHVDSDSPGALLHALLFIAVAAAITGLIVTAHHRHGTMAVRSGEGEAGDHGERSVAERGLPLRLLDLRTHLTVATLAAAQLRRRHVSTIAAARLCVYIMRAHTQMLDDIQALEAELGEGDHRRDDET